MAANQFMGVWNDLSDCLPRAMVQRVRHKALEGFEEWKEEGDEINVLDDEMATWMAENTTDTWFSDDIRNLIAGGAEMLELIHDNELYDSRRMNRLIRDRNQLKKIGGLARVLFSTLLRCPWVPLPYKAFLCACALGETEDEHPHDVATTLMGGTRIDILGPDEKTGLGGKVETPEGMFV